MRFITRNMWRRKGRTFLTIFGIVVGIFALTVLGGMTARLNQQVNAMKGLMAGQISVAPAGTNMHNMEGKFMGTSTAREIEKVPGVQGASGLIGVQLKERQGFGQPQMLMGYEVAHGEGFMTEIGTSEGRVLAAGDSGKVMLGSDLATQLKASVGGTVTLKGRPFTVVGILKSTLGPTDSWAFVPYEDALGIFLVENPFIKATGIAQQIEVTPKQGVDAEALAATLKKDFREFKVTSPKEAEKQISQITTIFSAIILGIAFIALFVGGLSVINTMIMSVSERTREIGLKKAIGAKTWTILGEYLAEASVIGLVAGVVGMLFGLLAITGFNRAGHSSNITIFTISATVVVGPVIFATILGAIAGFFPALRAARLNPVDSLKED